MNDDETRRIAVAPAFHRCAVDPKKNYGLCEPRMLWTLHVGPDAIAWELYTGWGMPTEAFRAACPDCPSSRHQGDWPKARVMAGPVDWHMSTPVLDDHHRIEECKVLGGPCYPDVGYLIGDELFDLLRVEGDEAVWVKMRELLVSYRAEVSAS